MQFKTIAIPLSLFALHASAKPVCKVELMARSTTHYNDVWFPLSQAVFTAPGKPGEITKSEYTLSFTTSHDCKSVTNEKLVGTIRHEEWKLQSSMTNI